MSEDRSTSSGRWLAWALLLVSAVLAFLVGRALWGEIQERRDGNLPEVAGGQTAKDAYVVLRGWMETWHQDAGVVSCSTTYRRGEVAQEGWLFQVYSPATSAIALVSIQGQEIAVLRERPALAAQSFLPEAEWKVSSQQALRFWWQNGGESAWRQPQNDAIHLRLGRNEEQGLTWQITVTQRQGTELEFWEISAASKELVEHVVGGE